MQPLVSIKVFAYNHERYVVKCIESTLMQRTNFPFEIIIGEDCSEDSTRDIVFSYADRYPELIRVVTSERNVGPYLNSVRVRDACRGEYQAICEGDDYWIDPLKLQKQVDFMEAHPQHSMCFHDAIILTQDRTSAPRHFCPRDLSETMTIEDIILRPGFIPTASLLVRSRALDSLPEWRRNVYCGDLVARWWCASQGPVGYIDDVMSVYRVHTAGLTATTDMRTDYTHQLYVYSEFDKETGYKYADLIARKIRQTKLRYLDCALRRRLGYGYFLLRPDRVIGRILTAIPATPKGR